MFSRRDSRWALVAFATLLASGCGSGGATIGAPAPSGNGSTSNPGTSPTPTGTPAPPFETASPGTTPTPVPSPTNLAKIACVGAPPYVSGTSPNFTDVGPSGVYTLTPEDANGNAISATLSFTAMNSAQGSTQAGATQNSFLATVDVLATAVPFVAKGNNANGTAVTQTCNITRVEALYVANRATNAGGNGVALPSSITVYPASANGNATPVATISGSNAETIATEFVAVDNNGYIFATNQGPMPGQTFSPTTSGYVAIYAPNSAGNVAPVGTIPNLGTPQGLAFDAKGNLYVVSIDRITEYPPSANGLGGPANPSNTITGAQTDLFSCYGLALDSSVRIYAACSNLLAIFPAGSTGDAVPTTIQPVGNTGSTQASRSWLGTGVDASGNIFAPASNQSLNMVDEYTLPTSSGTPVPSSEVASTSFSQPIDIVVDPSANYFVSNLGSNAIVSFAGATTLQTGLASTTLSGANTGLNQPFGIFVK